MQIKKYCEYVSAFLDNLNPEQPEVKKVFFDFVYLDKTDGESISGANNRMSI